MAAPLSLFRPPTAFASITRATIHPLPLAAILDHHLRRPDTQDRVFGTLLGVRNTETGEVEVRSSFGVPYVVAGQDVKVDSDHHRSLLELHHRVSPKELVLGWYATSPTLNSFSALLQDFYNAETASSSSLGSSSAIGGGCSALHLTLDPATLEFKCYTSAPVGLAQTLNMTFKPVPTTLSAPAADRTGIDLLTQSLFPSPLTSSSGDAAAPTPNDPISTQSPMSNLHTLLLRLRSMLAQVTTYVEEVVEGKREGDVQVGRYLLDTIGAVPVGKQPGAANGFEEDFQAHLSDVLMVSYLANLVRAQSEISGRLNLLVS